MAYVEFMIKSYQLIIYYCLSKHFRYESVIWQIYRRFTEPGLGTTTYVEIFQSSSIKICLKVKITKNYNKKLERHQYTQVVMRISSTDDISSERVKCLLLLLHFFSNVIETRLLYFQFFFRFKFQAVNEIYLCNICYLNRKFKQIVLNRNHNNMRD